MPSDVCADVPADSPADMLAGICTNVLACVGAEVCDAICAEAPPDWADFESDGDVSKSGATSAASVGGRESVAVSDCKLMLLSELGAAGGV